MGAGFKSFEDLEIYKAAREYRNKIYQLVDGLPPEEKYNLAGQMRRAALSLTNNIAEGHGRYHYQENMQFCRIARGSLMELIDDLNTCKDQNYYEPEYLTSLKNEGYTVNKILNGYIAYLKRRINEQFS